MGRKFAFIGAGSFGFTRGLIRDILSFPAFQDSELCLMDINPERLSYIKTAVERIVEAGKYPATDPCGRDAAAVRAAQRDFRADRRDGGQGELRGRPGNGLPRHLL